MNSLLDQFLSEARDGLRSISELLIRLEEAPGELETTHELFRMVHTLKGNSGLFDFPEMTRVLHASEDLMDSVRDGQTTYSRPLADQLLEAMDFVGTLCTELEATGRLEASHGPAAADLARALRALIRAEPHTPAAERADRTAPASPGPVPAPSSSSNPGPQRALPSGLTQVPEALRMEAFRRARAGAPLVWLDFSPDEQCFFHGDDPLLQALGTPELVWCGLTPRAPWPSLAELDAYRCVLNFTVLSTASTDQILSHFRYVPESIALQALRAYDLVLPQGDTQNGPAEESFVQDALALLSSDRLDALKEAVETFLQLCSPGLWIFSALSWLKAVLEHDPTNTAAMQCLLLSLRTQAQPHFALDPVAEPSARPGPDQEERSTPEAPQETAGAAPSRGTQDGTRGPSAPSASGAPPAEGVKYGRRAEDQPGSRTLKVDQVRIDRLMNLIGEMVVAKNSLPYLALRAENHFGVRELSREIKAQYSVINRIAEEMQDAIMQVRMTPISFVFQRFHRLVRDISHRLGKNVNLVLQGEETEADKNIVEALADPLVHIVRNSLDHGLELPEQRQASGKSPTGTLTIRAAQEADRVVIEIRDDGRGIDPHVIKRKAFEKGLITQEIFDTITDRDAIQLVFEPGFSTAEAISDLSGRGVGMDVVRTTVTKVNGSLHLESTVGKGTLIRISLPLSMAVTKVMIVEADKQNFGVPMDHVVETVRVARNSIHAIKHQQVAVLRGRIVALSSLSLLLGLSAPPKTNVDDECAVLVIRRGDETVGLLVDEFRETVDVIQKPMQGILAGLNAYSGSALMGDGSVLMILNVKELV